MFRTTVENHEVMIRFARELENSSVNRREIVDFLLASGQKWLVEEGELALFHEDYGLIIAHLQRKPVVVLSVQTIINKQRLFYWKA